MEQALAVDRTYGACSQDVGPSGVEARTREQQQGSAPSLQHQAQAACTDSAVPADGTACRLGAVLKQSRAVALSSVQCRL